MDETIRKEAIDISRFPIEICSRIKGRDRVVNLVIIITVIIITGPSKAGSQQLDQLVNYIFFHSHTLVCLPLPDISTKAEHFGGNLISWMKNPNDRFN